MPPSWCSASYDANNRLASAGSGGGATTFGYNVDGDLTAINGNTLTYNELHNLVSYTGDGASSAQYTYDGDSMRITKTTTFDGKTIVYHYDQGGRVLSESDGNGNYIADYIYLHGKLVAKVSSDAYGMPAAPTSLAASGVSSSQIYLTWTNNATNADGFAVERKTTGGTYSQIATLAGNAVSYTDSGLAQNTAYTYRVQAFNVQAGYSPYSNEASAATWPSLPPNAPTGLAASAIAYNEVDLVWADNSDNESGFVIERKDGAFGNYSPVGTAGQNITSYKDFTVNQSSFYYYRVKATNIVGDSPYSNELSVTTPSNQLLGGIIFTAAGNGQATYGGDGGPALLAGLNAPKGVAVDGAGNMYIADYNNARIRKVDANGVVTTLDIESQPGNVAVDSAGNVYMADTNNCRVLKWDAVTGGGSIVAGYCVSGGCWCGYVQDGIPATQALLNKPTAVAADNTGNIYIADTANNRIRMVDTSGYISTFAGTGTAWFGGDGGPAYGAGLNQPGDVKVDNAGNVYILDGRNYRIRKVTATTGTISTIAGNGQPGYAGDGGLAAQAAITGSFIALDSAGNVYLAVPGNNRIRAISTAGFIDAIAGTGQSGFSGDYGPATQASFNASNGITVDSSGNIYVADQGNNRIRKITAPTFLTASLPFGTVGTGYSRTLEAANAKLPYTWSVTAGLLPAGLSLNSATGLISGTPTSAGIYPFSVTLTDAASAMNTQNLVIAIYDPLLITTDTLAFGVTGTYSQALAASGGLQSYTWSLPYGGLPAGLTLDSSSGIISGATSTTGTYSFTVRVADANGTVASKYLSITIYPHKDIMAYSFASLHPVAVGIIDDTAKTISVIVPYGTNVTTLVASFSTSGTSVQVGSVVQVSGTTPNDFTNPAVYTVFDSDGSSITYTVTVTVAPYDPNFIVTIAGNGQMGYSGDGGPALQASINNPWGLSADSAGNIYFVDQGNGRIRMVSAGGIITTVAGNGQYTYSGDGGPATQAGVDPADVAADSAGNVYIADDYRVRKVSTSGVITTFAGTGQSGFGGDGGQATQAKLSAWAVAVDAAGNVYIADGDNYRVRKVNTSGVISTFAGNGSTGFSGDGGQATRASLSAYDVEADSAGNVYISDADNNRVRKVNTSGVITTIAGNGQYGYSGDGGSATQASIVVYSLASDPAGNIYLSDGDNNRVRKVNTSGIIITTIAGNGQAGYSGDGGPATLASFSTPEGLVADSAGNIYIGDEGNDRIRKVFIHDPGITTTALASGTVGASYSQTLAASGGFPPYLWSTTAGTLPAGLTLSSAGVISGAPTSAGTSTVTYQVTDANNGTSTKSLGLTIYGPVSITTSTLAPGTTGTSYSQTLAATGGKTPYTWSITAGSLPAGLSLAGSTGVISGTPTTAGTSTFTAQVMDANNAAGTKSLSISINAPLSITTSSLPAATHGTAYSQTLAATGGLTPYTWSISSGKLPTGLTLNSSTGVISGTPTKTGTYSFTAKVTDANAKTATKSLSIKVN